MSEGIVGCVVLMVMMKGFEVGFELLFVEVVVVKVCWLLVRVVVV